MLLHAYGVKHEAAVEAHVDVLAVALDAGPIAHNAADGFGAGKRDVGCRWPQPQMPSVAYKALYLVG